MDKLTASELYFLETFRPWLKANKRGWDVYLRYRKDPDELNNPFDGGDLKIARQIYPWILKGSNEAKFREWWDDVEKEEDEDEGQGVEQEKKGLDEQQNEQQQLQENKEREPPIGEHSTPLAQQPEESDKGAKRPHETGDGNTAKKRKETAPVEHSSITTAGGAELSEETISSRIGQIERDNDLRNKHKWRVMHLKRGRFQQLIQEQRAAYQTEEETRNPATERKENPKRAGGMFGDKHKSKKKKAETGADSTGVQKEVQQDTQKDAVEKAVQPAKSNSK
jgi:hypothetical protein